MTDIDEQGRPEPPPAGNEIETLLGFLDFHRATLAWKCSGLDAAGLATTVAGSSMTLGGLLKHLAHSEAYWAGESLHGLDPEPPWTEDDWDSEWTSAAGESPEQLRAFWEGWVARSRVLIAEALADRGLDGLARRSWPDGRTPSVRWVLLHLLEEYIRHNGHADLLREAVDGRTGQ